MSAFPPISSLIPQRGPMCLLDEVIEWDETRVRCRLTLRASSQFVEEGRVAAHIGLEYMAQAVAAHTGLQRLRAGTASQASEPRVLLSCRKMRLHRAHFEVGETLEIEARCLGSSAALASFDAAITIAPDHTSPVVTAQLHVSLEALHQPPQD